MKKSIIAAVIVVAIAVLLITIVFTINFEEKKDIENNDATDDSGNNQNDEEPLYHMSISISADKKEYNSNETVNLTLTVINNMNISFPYGEYSLGLKYVNKSKYGSIDGYSTVDIPWDDINLIEIPANETIIYNYSWNITGVASGEFVILFEIHKAISTGGHSIEYSAIFEIKVL